MKTTCAVQHFSLPSPRRAALRGRAASAATASLLSVTWRRRSGRVSCVPTSPYGHVFQILNAWRVSGYVVYHHDMFQTGYGTSAVPPSGIPDPEFSPYHRQVFAFLKLRECY